MKKVIAFLWAGVLALGLLTTGCAGEKEEKETGAEASQREELQKVTLTKWPILFSMRLSMWP